MVYVIKCHFKCTLLGALVLHVKGRELLIITSEVWNHSKTHLVINASSRLPHLQ